MMFHVKQLPRLSCQKHFPALLVIAGKYGNGQDRVDALTADGYDYNRVQKCVNELLKVIEKYG